MIVNNHTGFTLLELMVVLIIVGSLIFLGQVGISNILTHTQAHNDAYRFFLTLTFARQSAIHQNRLVTVCPTIDQQTCSQNWSDGYMVFFDKQTLRHEKWHPNTILISQKVSQIQFTGDGRCLQRTTLQIETDKVFKIVIYDSGRIRFATA